MDSEVQMAAETFQRTGNDQKKASWIRSACKKSASLIGNISSFLAYSEGRPAQLQTSSEKPKPTNSYEDFDLEKTNRFQNVIKRLVGHPDYDPTTDDEAPYGKFLGRPIIGEHTKINGGVYVGTSAQEALVIDEKYGLLKECYTELMLRYVRKYGTKQKDALEQHIVKEIIDLTKEKLRYRSNREIEEFAAGKGYKLDRKISLDIYIESGLGTDRHQILLAAYLLEKLKEAKYLKGKVYLDSHFKNESSAKEKLIYSNSDGYLFIFSPSDNPHE